jgi:hypothetical protein
VFYSRNSTYLSGTFSTDRSFFVALGGVVKVAPLVSFINSLFLFLSSTRRTRNERSLFYTFLTTSSFSGCQGHSQQLVHSYKAVYEDYFLSLNLLRNCQNDPAAASHFRPTDKKRNHPIQKTKDFALCYQRHLRKRAPLHLFYSSYITLSHEHPIITTIHRHYTPQLAVDCLILSHSSIAQTMKRTTADAVCRTQRSNAENGSFFALCIRGRRPFTLSLGSHDEN